MATKQLDGNESLVERDCFAPLAMTAMIAGHGRDTELFIGFEGAAGTVS